MRLPERFADDFAPDVKDRGRDYFHGGEVRILRADARGILARVRGNALYKVEFDFYEDGDWQGECSCPFNQDRLEPCKHMWATLLEAAAQGRLAGAEPPERPAATTVSAEKSTSVPKWKRVLVDVREQMLDQQRRRTTRPQAAQWPADRRLIYIIDLAQTANLGRHREGVLIELGTERQRNGRYERLKRFQLDLDQWLAVPDEADRTIAQMLIGAQNEYGSYPVQSPGGGKRFVVPSIAFDTTLRRMCETGRCRVKLHADDDDPQPVTWDDGPAWEFNLELVPREGSNRCTLSGVLLRGEQRLAVNDAAAALGAHDATGIVIANGQVARLNHYGALPLLLAMRQDSTGGNGWGAWLPPVAEPVDLIRELAGLPMLPPLRLPEGLGVREVRTAPQPNLRVRRARDNWIPDAVIGELTFEYEGYSVIQERLDPVILDSERGFLIHRDIVAEQRAGALLSSVGFKSDWDPHVQEMRHVLPLKRLSGAVIQLTAEGWHVEAEGKLYRLPSPMKVQVSSGIDWFDVTAQVEFSDDAGSHQVGLPTLLAALEKGETFITLDDGSIGILPEEWLKKYGGVLAQMGVPEGEALRFSKAQAGLLDVLLAAMPEARVDEVFNAARRELKQFSQIQPSDAPPGFVGELRPYQREGLGWLEFLQRFGFGGCLADDMGLGKTIQVLALLEKRRQSRAQGKQNSGPSLVVVPRSLVFNWRQEAAKFTPQLRVLDHSGAGRERETTEHLKEYDLVVTTYGTLRRDAALFKDFTFDYAILDEAQAIKNASSESAKAARLLRANHRLAMSGTPIENHLGELWSLFEYLNPGMLGRAGAFRELGGGGGNGADSDVEGRKLIASAVRPFILRRTKQQVARELPEKMEQTIFCQMEEQQRKLYDELRDHYRQTLLGVGGQLDTLGINKSKMQILEALLRLRQAACHPGLIDKDRSNEPSAKLEALLNQLEEVLEEGHKVLVFSQFVSLLTIVRSQLDERKVIYEYLDGQTRDRQQRVERFQNDPTVRLFLISLKAGGLGLNLTEANYVFLLDPWWNPAVEAQAIDRAHRIGQTRNVFAYRLIAKDTVEEKVLELQQSKRELADAIINADNSLIGKLGREDLERLLS